MNTKRGVRFSPFSTTRAQEISLLGSLFVILPPTRRDYATEIYDRWYILSA
jgi:hypothetical protein